MTEFSAAEKLKVFISYSRADMAAADALVGGLEGSGFEVAIDRRDLPYGEEWQEELADFIRNCDTVIWLASPASLQSRWCRWELGEVARINKRLVPIRISEFDPSTLPEALGRIHLLPAEEVFQIERHLPTLVRVLHTDRAWIKEGTRLADRARQWLLRGKAGALLIWGSALRDAEKWRDQQPRDAPQPAQEVLDLILASRRAATRRGRYWAIAATAVACLGIGLSGYAFWQREIAVANEQVANEQTREANKQRQEATLQRDTAQRSQSLAEQNEARAVENERRANEQRIENLRAGSRLTAVSAQRLVEESMAPVAQAIALEGLPRWDPPERPLVAEAVMALQRAVRADHSTIELTVQGENILSAAVTPDGHRLLLGTGAGSLVIWNLDTYRKEQHIKTRNDTITQIDVSPDGKLALVSGGMYPGLWEIETGKPNIALPPVERGFARTARFSPDGSRIALGYSTNHAEIREAKSGGLLHDLKGPTDFLAAYKRRKSSIWGSSSIDDPIILAVEQAQWRIWGGMTDVAFSPDGKVVATTGMADAEGAARLFSVETGKLLATLGGESLTNNYNNQRMAFSPDGALFAVAARDRFVRVWNVADGRLRAELPHTVDAQALTFDRSSSLLAVGYDDGSVRLWNTEDARLLSVFTAHSERVTSLAFSPDQQLLATSSDDRTVKLWWNTLDPRRCTPKDRHFCDSSMRPAAALRGHTDKAHLLVFSPDSSKLASVSRDATVRLWRPRDTGTYMLPSIAGDDDKLDVDSFIDPGLNIAFTPDGSRVLAQNGWRRFTVWQTGDRKIACRLTGIRLSRSARDKQPAVHMMPFEARPATCPKPAPADRNSDRDIDGGSTSDYRWLMSPDGTRAIGAKEWLEPRKKEDDYSRPSDDEPRRLIDVANRKALATLAYNGRRTQQLEFSADGSVVLGLLAAGKDDNPKAGSEGAVWDARTGALLGTTGVWGQSFNIAALAEDGRQFVLAAASSLAAVRFEVVTGRGIRWQVMTGPAQPIVSATISADGSVVAASYIDGTVQLLTGEDGKLLATLSAGNYRIEKLAFSSDRRLLVGADASRTVWLWDVASKMVLTSVPFKTEPIAIVFSPDNKQLAIQTKDAELHLMTTGLDWMDLEKPEDLIDWARGSLSASLSPSERQRFLLQADGGDETGRQLANIKPVEYPKPSIQKDRANVLKSCDALAANPADRYRQANGVAFEKIDLARGLAACDAAVAAFPDDPIARYQRGRVHERAGRVHQALDDYKLSADAGNAAATRRIGQLIEMKTVGPDAGLGPLESWMDRAAAAGDPFALLNVAIRAARSQGRAGAAIALSNAAAAYDGSLVNAAMRIVLEIDNSARTAADKESAYFWLQLAQRVQRATPSSTEDRTLRNQFAERLRILPRQLKPSVLVRVYREARDWKP